MINVPPLDSERNKKDTLAKKLGYFRFYEIECTYCRSKMIRSLREKKELWINKKFFCSDECSKKRIWSDDTKKNISNTVKKQWQNESFREDRLEKMNTKDAREKFKESISKYIEEHPEFYIKLNASKLGVPRSEEVKKKISEATRKAMNCESVREKIKENFLNGKNGFSKYLTDRISYPEECAMIILDELKQNYEFQYQIMKKELGIGGICYYLDFFIPEINLNIEIDGKQHEKSREKDRERDEVLKKIKNIDVVRIKWKDYNHLKENITSEILKRNIF